MNETFSNENNFTVCAYASAAPTLWEYVSFKTPVPFTEVMKLNAGSQAAIQICYTMSQTSVGVGYT